jgi:hypothetical protein
VLCGVPKNGRKEEINERTNKQTNKQKYNQKNKQMKKETIDYDMKERLI